MRYIFSIILDDVALTHLTFSADFTSAVEEKQIAEQRAEMARYKVEKAEQIKIANIIKAEGDSEAAKLVADVSFLFSVKNIHSGDREFSLYFIRP